MSFEKQFKQILCEEFDNEDFSKIRERFVEGFKRMWVRTYRSPHLPYEEEDDLKDLIKVLKHDILTNTDKLERIDGDWEISPDWAGFHPNNWDQILLELTEEQAGIILDDIFNWIEENIL